MKETAEKQTKRHPDVFAGSVWVASNEVHIRGSSRGRIADLHSNSTQDLHSNSNQDIRTCVVFEQVS